MASSIPRPRASMTASQGLSPVMKVPLGSRVVLSRRRNGTVRYVGKLANESGEWYGVALDEAKGDNDGAKGKERYFYCPPNHGVFVRRKEINFVKEVVVLPKGPPSPVTDESSSCGSNVSYTSTDQQGEAHGAVTMGIVHPVNSDGPTSPLMKTFKGFRKQLDFISLKTVGPGRSREASPVTSPTSSSPSSPTTRSGLKPPSPFRRFSSFSQGLPTPPSPGSPTNKTTVAASPGDRRRQSVFSSSSKPSPIRRTTSFRTPTPDINEDIRPVENTSPPSPNRFHSFQYSPTNQFSIAECSTGALTSDENDVPAPSLAPESPASVDEVPPTTSDCIASNLAQSTLFESAGEEAPQTSSIRDDSIIILPVENSAPVETMVGQASVYQEHFPRDDSRVASFGRTGAFHVPPIDFSALAELNDFVAGRLSPIQSPRDSSEHYSSHNSPVQSTDDQTEALSTDRTCSFRSKRSSIRVPSIDTSRGLDSPPTQDSPPSSSRRSNSVVSLLFDRVNVLDDDSDDDQDLPTDAIVPSQSDDVSEVSAASAPEIQVDSNLPQRSPRARLELTTVELLSPEKKLTESEDRSGERPLFFRRTNVGRSPIERRSSYSSFSASSSSPTKSPTSNSVANAASRSARVAELEREISVMRSSHENIVAVLRATNKQHAANVLELRAQVAALTEGNLWLERQLTAKSELVRELRDMEKQQHRDTVSVGEVQKILEIKDAQIQTLEREMAQLRNRLARLESDKYSQLYRQYQHFEARRDRDEKRINDLRKEVLEMCNERLELQSEVRDLKEMSLRFF